ncbi:MAG: TonB-dependent receptor [Ginsengibacter sp.]
MYKKIFVVVLFGMSFHLSKSQNVLIKDTNKVKNLDSVIVIGYLKRISPKFLSPIEGVNIFSGKKSNLLYLDPSMVNLAQNNARTSFAQIPGLTMWEMDGAGLQINIGSRGTDSHRSIEMNMRQNGYNINSDVFGYPEDHYTPPLQGVDHIQMVRGSAALQFGSQFGGMFNYVMKSGDTLKKIMLESEQTAGSNNLYNSFNAIGGRTGKISYYAYYDDRHGDGFRSNANFNYHAYYFTSTYKFNSKSKITLQFSRMDYLEKIAGGLTDQQFTSNFKQSTRTRNYFSPEINIPAVIFNHEFNANTKLELTSSVIFGQRNSVQFIAAPSVLDTVNTSLRSFNPRQVDRDYYSGVGLEGRVLHIFKIANVKNTVATGLRYSNETTTRRQKGIGTIASDYDLTLVAPYGIDLKFKTGNFALFAENEIKFNQKLSVTPGIRYEIINTILSGKINNQSVDVNYKGNRSFPLFGLGLQYKFSKFTELYGNISQAYRPFLYANVTPADRVDIIDPNLKDSKGYDIDLGYRGSIEDIFNFDVNVYYLFYGNKIGLLSEKRVDGTSYLLTTNIGDATIKGIEGYMEVSLLKSLLNRHTNSDVRIFNSVSFSHGRYTSGELSKSGNNINLSGNRVENLPELVSKSGLIIQHNNFNTTLQYSYISKSFNDAFNTVTSSNSITGLIPSYQVWDLSLNWQIYKLYRLSGGVNNFSNEKYFNRRITMYPGPGILPADGRTYYISFAFKI